ncbi:MAG: alpha/beta hydrolase [Actinomycetota bacterium]|nr:alpha/beta hydrolase [Actinomycetota bacterium]
MTTVVLLHAFPLDSAMYDSVRGPLGQVCDLVTPDFPGFGGGPIPDGEPSLNAYADAVVAGLDSQGLDRVVLGGTSMGGYTTMAVLRRHPERVSAVLLIDTKAAADAEAGRDGRLAMADTLESEDSSRPLLDVVFPKLLGTTTFGQRPEVADRVRAAVAAASPRAAAWAQRAMAARPDSFDTLRAATVPALIVVGEEDVLCPPPDAAAMAAAISGATLAVVPESGHLSPVEAPDAVVEVVSGFLDQLG